MFKWNASVSLVSLVIVPLASAQAQPANQVRAQTPGPPPVFWLNPLSKQQLLLNYPAIQEELKVTPTQKAKLDKIQGEMRRQTDDRLNEAIKAAEQSPDIEARQDFVLNIKQDNTLRAREFEPELLKVLNRDQRTRLDQIQLQADGPAAFVYFEDVQQRLNLSPEQIVLIKEIIDQGRNVLADIRERTKTGVTEKVQKARRTSGQQKGSEFDTSTWKAIEATREKGWTEIVELRKSTEREVAKVLTKKQRETYVKMLGKPFIVNGRLVSRASAPDSKAETKPSSSDNKAK